MNLHELDLDDINFDDDTSLEVQHYSNMHLFNIVDNHGLENRFLTRQEKCLDELQQEQTKEMRFLSDLTNVSD